MRTIGIATASRADYGIYRPIMRAIDADPELDLAVVATGAHLLDEFGRTVSNIEADGFTVAHRVDMPMAGDAPADIATAMGTVTQGFAKLFADWRPDILLIQGDRYELHAVAVAALPFNIPLAHIHGGEITEGAFDDALRHATTKMAHLHFVAAEDYAARVRQLGEADWRITVCGAPGLDNLHSIDPAPAAEIEHEFGIDLASPPILATFHPVTLEIEDIDDQVQNFLSALGTFPDPIVFSAPNADTGSRTVRNALGAFVAKRNNTSLVENLGTRNYFGLMALAKAMVGNSSSGIIEAASFGLPVVNIGTRQKGRIRGRNVIDCAHDSAAICRALTRALDPGFRRDIANIKNPYSDGHAAEKIVEVLRSVPIDRRLLVKTFVDFGAPAENRVAHG